MTDSTTRVAVHILDKEYHVACRPSEKDNLLAAAQELDARMRRIRNGNAVIGMDRIAVMAALNLCNELQQCHKAQKSVPHEDDLLRLASKLDGALDP